MTKSMDRALLLDWLPAEAIGAEIGVWRGAFSQILLDVLSPTQLHLVDPWIMDEDPKYSRAAYGSKRAPDMDVMYNNVWNKFRSDQRVSIHRCRSKSFWGQLDDNSIDFAYIDGDHSFDGVHHDLCQGYRAIKDGGYLCGDDYTSKGWWGTGVIDAVQQIRYTHPTATIEIIGHQYLIKVMK